MTMVFIVLVSLLLVSLLGFMTTVLRSRAVYQDRSDAAEAARSAIQMLVTLQVEHGPNGCFDGPDSDWDFNGSVVAVNCTATSPTSIEDRNVAATILGTGPGEPAFIAAPVNGVVANSVAITGDLYLHQGSIDLPEPSAVALQGRNYGSLFTTANQPAGRYEDNHFCNDTTTATAVSGQTRTCIDADWNELVAVDTPAGALAAPMLPTIPTQIRTASSWVDIGPGCRALFPGTYPEGIGLEAGFDYFFTSGVYYLEAPLDIPSGVEVVAGQGATVGCSFDSTAAYSAALPDNFEHSISGGGATIILGADAMINNAGSLTMNRRIAAPTNLPTANTAVMSVTAPSANRGINESLVLAGGCSLDDTLTNPACTAPVSTYSVAVAAGTLSYKPSTVTTAIESTAAADPDPATLSFGSKVFTPNAAIEITSGSASSPDNNSVIFDQGLTAARLELALTAGDYRIGEQDNLRYQHFAYDLDVATKQGDNIGAILRIDVDNTGDYALNTWRVVSAGGDIAAADSQPPTDPADLGATINSDRSVTVTWSPATDDVGIDRYLVYDNATVIATTDGVNNAVTVFGLGAGNHYLQVQAVDAAGNESARVGPVEVTVNPAEAEPPTTPTGVAAVVNDDNTISFSWQLSTDNVAVGSYELLASGVVIADVDHPTNQTTVNIGDGTHYLTVVAVDVNSNRSAPSAAVAVTVGTDPADTSAPSVPSNPTGTSSGGDVTFSWGASSDNVGVDHYIVYRNNVIVATVDHPATTVTLGLGTGNHYMQVRAVDAAGNQSAKTSPVLITAAATPDTSAPSVPSNLTGQANLDESLTVEWGASSDNVGVDHYIVYRNNVIVATVDHPATTVTLGLGTGNHYMQVRAVDAAGNQSAKTSPVLITVAAATPDTSAPSVPSNPTGTSSGGDVTFSWGASSDNVGVDHYIVYRNNVIVATVDHPATTVTLGLGTGNHYMQVRAVDAAGNQSAKTSPVLITV